ncbi:MAG: hypothetical protein ACK5QX_09085, partial [bacterium]
MRNLEMFLSPLMITTIVSCCGQNTDKDTLNVEAYSSYNNSSLPTVLSLTNQETNYDSLINNALELIGL